MRIGINCGHTVSGEIGCGAVGGIDESVEARNVGYALEALLRSAGHTVYDCTNDHADSVGANLSNIVNMANAQPLDLILCQSILTVAEAEARRYGRIKRKRSPKPKIPAKLLVH